MEEAVLFIALIGLAYDLWRPVSAGNILYPILGAMVAIALITSVLSRLRPNPALLIASGLLFAAAAVGAVVGSWGGQNPGLNQQMIQWFGTIGVWSIFANAFTVKTMRRAMVVLALMTLAVAGTIVLYVGANTGLLPSVIPESLVQGQGAGFDQTDQGSAIRWLGLSTLAAATPLMLAAAVMGRDRILPRRIVTLPVGLLALLATAVAGRRAILVVAVVSPLLALLMRRLLTARAKRRFTIRPVWIYLAPLILLSAISVWGTQMGVRVQQAFADTAATYFGVGQGSGTAKTADDVIRIDQSQKLLDAWATSPVYGKGLGAVLPDFARSADRPWDFELQYHLLLFNTGLIGALLCAAALGIAGRELRRTAMAHPEFVPSLVATSVAAVSLLLANASNPYMQAVGHGWGIALAAGTVALVARLQSSAVVKTALVEPERVRESARVP